MSRASTAVLAVAMIAVVFTPRRASAQFPSAVENGARIRLWIPEERRQNDEPWRRQRLRGTVASVTPDTLHLSVPGTVGTLAFARQSIMRIDVSRGRPSRAASAFERAISGAIVGAISAAITNDPYGSKRPNYSRDWRAAEEGAKWGAVAGAVIGFTLPTERWRRVRLSR